LLLHAKKPANAFTMRCTSTPEEIHKLAGTVSMPAMGRLLLGGGKQTFQNRFTKGGYYKISTYRNAKVDSNRYIFQMILTD
jgi:hypothetical protein